MGTTNLEDLTLSGALAAASAAVTGASTAANFTATGVVKGGAGIATASSNAGTISKQAGVLTTESLTTAGLAAQDLTITNTLVAATSHVFASVQNGSNTQGAPDIGLVTPGAGSVVIQLVNRHASQAFNGTLKVSFIVFPA